MDVTVSPGRLPGRVVVPGSKSHTIRALVIAALARGQSHILQPLESADTESCVRVLRALGIKIDEERERAALAALHVRGGGGTFSHPDGPLDCANSGTTFFVMLSVAALAGFPVTLTGDDQLQRRSAGPLLAALEALGATVERTNGDCAPVTVIGPLRGGAASIACPTSQYLSSLLLATPMASGTSTIAVPLLNERPYVHMTLGWLDAQSITYEREALSRFRIPGGQAFHAFTRSVPADFSAATFFLAAAAVTGSELLIQSLDMTDSQGDKEVVHILERLGCSVQTEADGVRIAGGRLAGGEIDLNAIPDALPALAVVGTACSEPLRLVNVPQAREKETDRIAVMAEELRKLGARVDELADGLVVHPSELAGGTVESHGDHRIAMAASILALSANSPVKINNTACIATSYPKFLSHLQSLRS